MSVDWLSAENHLLLNPRLPLSDQKKYETSWKSILRERNMTGHIGIATSGSSSGTAEKTIGRLVLISKAALLASAEAVNERFAIEEHDIWMKTLPTFHVGGLGIYARAFLSRSQVVESKLDKWDPIAFSKELEDSQATLVSLVPTQLYDFVDMKARAPTRLRAAIVGGGKLYDDIRDRAIELGWPVYPSYGLTECCSQVATAISPTDARLFLLGHVELKVNADDLIEIRSRALLTGWLEYANERVSFKDPKDGEWFTTEDRGRLNADGSLSVLGRSIDFLKIGGEGVSLARLEEIFASLKEQSGFKNDAVLLAASDERLGAKIVLLTNAESSLIEPLIERFNGAVAPFERIRSLHVLSEIPRSSLGKLLRRQALMMVGLNPVDRP